MIIKHCTVSRYHDRDGAGETVTDFGRPTGRVIEEHITSILSNALLQGKESTCAVASLPFALGCCARKASISICWRCTVSYSISSNRFVLALRSARASSAAISPSINRRRVVSADRKRRFWRLSWIAWCSAASLEYFCCGVCKEQPLVGPAMFLS